MRPTRRCRPVRKRQNTRHVWLVDPIDKRLEVYALDDTTFGWRQVRIYEGDVTVRAPPFEAIDLDLTALWSGPQRG